MRIQDLVVLIGIILIVLMMVIPIPLPLLDLLLIINISVAILILLVALNTEDALSLCAGRNAQKVLAAVVVAKLCDI